MSVALIVLAVVVVLLIVVVGYVISVYNGLNKLKVRIEASIQEIGNQLKRQASLIPNLESTVKGYAAHEKGVYDGITSARAGINKAIEEPTGTNMASAEKGLAGVLSGMRIVMESNPELKANQNFQALMTELTNTADKVTLARRLLIDLSAKYNEMLQTFPSNVIASAFGFKEEAGLAVAKDGSHINVSAEETADPKVSF